MEKTIPRSWQQHPLQAKLDREVVMAAEKIHLAMDLKEASSLKSPWEQHVTAPDAAAMLEIDQEVDELCTSPEKKPTHDKMAKLLEMRSSLSQHAHVKGTPEDALWRDEMKEAVDKMAA